MSDIKLKDVKRLRLNPGDSLVVRLGEELTEEDIQRAMDNLKEVFPDNKILILGRDYELEVLEDGSFITGTGQKLRGVHSPDQCEGEYCCIHNPSDHSMKDFPTHWRADRGIMERICPHGVGHPDPDDMAFITRTRGEGHMEGVHGCDGCCNG